ncbi:M48 family metalloprotease [bacterium]|nr:M48 family metalloprotease [bacterium]
MSKLKAHFFLIFLISLNACTTARRPVVPGEIPTPRPVSVQDEQYGHQVLEQLSKEYDLDYNDPRLSKIERVVDKLTKAANVDKAPWHVYLFKAPEVKNAAATRGNHIFVWSGLLDFTQTEEELATVLSHEIAHLLAGHTDPDPNEQVKKILIAVGAVAASTAVSTVSNGAYSSLGDIASSLTQGIGSGIFLNPYSRQLELEADHVGLFMMADAKYDPARAVAFWARVQDHPDFQTGPQFFSTHPPAQERLTALQNYLPEAELRFQGKATKQNFASANNMSVTSSQWQSSPNNQRDRMLNLNQSHARVISNRAIVYASPSSQSRKLGEIRLGGFVNILSEKNGWTQITAPTNGFVRSADIQ